MVTAPSIVSTITNIDDRIPLMDGKNFGVFDIIPLSTIREHCKIEDVPNVTDAQLEMYMESAIETAERYLGWRLKGVQQHIQDIPNENTLLTSIRNSHIMGRMPTDTFRPFYKMELDYPVYDGLIYIFGHLDGTAPRLLRVKPGATQIDIPRHVTQFHIESCCRPCGSQDGPNPNLQITYRAGFDCPKLIPAGVKLGMLKLIAWTVSNPGDEIMTVRNRQSRSDTGIVGTNNGALVSGAIELWRVYMRDAR